MAPEEVRKLKYGLYRLFFYDEDLPSGESLAVAAVGGDHAGRHWFAATNWISGPCFDWDNVARAELLTTQREEIEAMEPNRKYRGGA